MAVSDTTIAVPSVAGEEVPQVQTEGATGPFEQKNWGTVPASVTARTVLTEGQAEQILRAPTGADIVSLLAGLPQCSNEFVSDMYFHLAGFCRKNGFDPEKTCVLFLMVVRMHEMATSTPHDNLSDTFGFFKRQLHTHNVQRPPFSEAVFTLTDSQAIMEFVLNTYFRHFKLYKYAFTPEPVVDLVLEAAAWPIPVEPEPEPEPTEDAVGEDGEAVGGDGGDVEQPADAEAAAAAAAAAAAEAEAAAEEELEDAPTDEAAERLQTPLVQSYRASLVEALAPKAQAIKLDLQDRIMSPDASP